MAKFNPNQNVARLKRWQINIQLDADQHARLVKAAEKSGVSKTELGRQAVIYALDNMAGE